MLVTVDEWPAYSAAAVPTNAATLLAAVSGQVVGYCGWSIARETVIGQILDGDGSWLLRLPTLRLVSVTEVLVDDEVVTDYAVSPRGMLDRRPNIWPDTFGSIQASYIHGYDPVPDEIKALIVGLSSRLASSSTGYKRLTVGRITTEAGDSATDNAPGLNPFDKLALEPYRLEHI